MKQAIALAGGGTKGAYQVGAWKAMRELGIPFDIVTGTSIGSVTAALMVQGDFDRAWELWTSTAGRRTSRRTARSCTNISTRRAFSPRRWISDS